MTKMKWVLDAAESELRFKIKHLMVTNVSGFFRSFQVDVEYDGETMDTLQVSARIDATSIFTNNGLRDEHLRSDDFLSVERFPEIAFQSTGEERVSDRVIFLPGILTMRGILKPVRLCVEYGGAAIDPWGNLRAGFSISAKINRSDWGVNFNEGLRAGGMMLGEEITIDGEMQFIKQGITEGQQNHKEDYYYFSMV